MGWYSDAALTKKWNFNANVTGNVTLYAKWLQIAHVSFNPMGGTPSPLPQTLLEGEKAVQPTDPARDNDVFLGWYTEGGQKWDFKTPLTGGDLQLHAEWTVRHLVRFSAMGGSAVPDRLVVNGQATSAPVSTNKGYRLMGWSTTPNGAPWDFNTPILGNTTLYALWEREYTVSFNNNGGDGACPAQKVLEGQAAQNLCVPARGQDTFLGWFQDKAAKIPWDFDTPVKSDMTLYAGWLPFGWHLVTFHPEGGTFVPSETVEDGTAVAQPKNPSMTASAHEVFDGWVVRPELDSPRLWDFSTPVTDSMDLYATWRCAGGYHRSDDESACIPDVCGPSEIFLEGVGCLPGCPPLDGSARQRQVRAGRARAREKRGMPFYTIQSFTPRAALAGMVGAIALGEAGLAHILNAEGEKIQHFLFNVPVGSFSARRPKRVDRLLEMGKGADAVLRGVGRLERMFQNQLFLSVSGWPAKLEPLRVRKVDDRGDPVGGAAFVFEGEGFVERIVSDADGWLVVNCLPPGVYNVTELFAPDGYIQDDVSHTLTLSMDGTMHLDGRLDGQLVNRRA
jgi:uncharacterized repeat protein (TIGR02543 family)